MTDSDLKGIKERGAAARQAGAGFHENPFYFTSGAFEEWVPCAAAWTAGWLEEDAGRDQNMARMMRVQWW